MKIAAFQFKGSGRIEDNFDALRRGIVQAAAQNARFLLTQECALCGYPPVEVESVRKIDFGQAQEAAAQIARLAALHQMSIGLGTVLPDGDGWANAIVLISPAGEQQAVYHKRALWGWDRDSFKPGRAAGVATAGSIRLGFRICYEVRFPEYFRELFREQVDLVCVSFCDVSPEPNPARYELIKSHLVTRAVENALFVLSANSVSGYSTAPTLLVDPDGNVLAAVPPDQEALLAFEWQPSQSNFGREGRIQHSRELLGMA